MATGSKFKNAISWLGLVDDDRFEELAVQDRMPPQTPVPAPVPQAEPMQKQPVEPQPRSVEPQPRPSGGFHGDNSQTVLLTTGVVIAPASYRDIQPIADRYRSGLPTIMNLRVMPIEDAKHSVDFFSGMLYALEGSIRRVAKGVFLLEPPGVALDKPALDQALADLR